MALTLHSPMERDVNFDRYFFSFANPSVRTNRNTERASLAAVYLENEVAFSLHSHKGSNAAIASVLVTLRTLSDGMNRYTD